MSGTQPVGVYAMKIPPGDILLPAVPDFAAMFRVSMAAIDPAEEPMYNDEDTTKKVPRATLKIVRIPGDMFGDDEDDSEDDDDVDFSNGLANDSDEDSEEVEVNGGPSKPKKVNTIKAEEEDGNEDDEDMADADEDDAEAIAALKKVMKGKGKAEINGGDKLDDVDEDDEDPLELEEVVVCTLDPEKNYQQTLDFVVGEDERVFFKVSGTHTVHLTGNYVIPMDDGQTELYDDEDDEEDYDLSPDEDELEDALDALGDEESDELDDLENPRVTEIASDDEVPALHKATDKGRNKRPVEVSDDEEDGNLDELIASSLKKEEVVPATNGDAKKLSKAEKRAMKKLKKNDGVAAPGPSAASQISEPKDIKPMNGSEKKSVQFAKNLEQGPTPSANTSAKAIEKKADPTKPTDKSASLGIKDVQGVTVDDRKLGTGPVAKKGSRVEMRYIGKLDSGKVFDSNKKGKPFSFKLGMGEVIKGWDIGVAGMNAGAERRLTIPAHHGYGKKGAPPDIPPNAKLIFDIKCLGVY